MQYADDNAAPSHDIERLQQITDDRLGLHLRGFWPESQQEEDPNHPPHTTCRSICSTSHLHKRN